MRRLPNCFCVLIATLLAGAAVAPMCVAQDWRGNGTGNTPMPPAAPTSPERFSRPVVPGPPGQPPITTRPSSWPGAQADASLQAPEGATPMPEDMTPCSGIRIIARVGSNAILESELVLRSFDKHNNCEVVAGAVDKLIEINKDRIPPDQMEAQQEALTKQLLKSIIQSKLIYQDAKHNIPAEGLPKIEKKLSEEFDENEVGKMMKAANVNSRQEFDQKLRSLGTSLDHEKRAFIERTLAREWIGQQINRKEEVPYDQLLVYYHDHQAEFTTPARAKYEELTVHYSKFPTRVAAFDAVARLGNQVVGGAPLAEVAKSGSDGFTAANGGQSDWTGKGALTCEALDAALFNLPVGQLSPIIAGANGYYIIRVTQREEAVVKPFRDAQVEIKKKISQERTEKQFREYMAKLEARTPVWTIFDGGKDGPMMASPPDRPLRR